MATSVTFKLLWGEGRTLIWSWALSTYAIWYWPFTWFLFSFFLFWLHHTTFRILGPPPGIEPTAVKLWSPNPWPARESPLTVNLKESGDHLKPTTSQVHYSHTFWDVAEGCMVPMATVLGWGPASGFPRSKSISSPCTKPASCAHSDGLTNWAGGAQLTARCSNEVATQSGLCCFHCLKCALSCFPISPPCVRCLGVLGDLMFPNLTLLQIMGCKA